MNHPTREEWMSYLYDELTAEEHSSLAAHLAVCPECKMRVNDWRSARKNLDAWQLPARPARVPLQRPLVRWAAAAALMIGIGFGVGRFATSATANAGKIRAAIEPEIRQQLRQEFTQLLRDELDKAASATLAASGEQTKHWVEDYAQALEAKRTEDGQAIKAALNKLESQLLADVFSLKKDVDTLAVWTDAGLRRARQELVQLADYTQPADISNSPQK
jgi:anti-sigma factor RsiW